MVTERAPDLQAVGLAVPRLTLHKNALAKD